MPTSKDFTYTRSCMTVTIKDSSGQMRQLYAYVANESTRRWRQDAYETHKRAHGSWILCSVSRVRSKTCILCSALRYKSYLTLPHVTSLRDSFCLGTFAHVFARLLVGNKDKTWSRVLVRGVVYKRFVL